MRWLVDGEQADTGLSYIVSPADAGKSISAEVVPVAQTGSINGVAVKSENVTAKARSFILFEARDTEGNQSTWATDGTNVGTQIIANFNTNEDGVELVDAIDFGDKKILSVNSDGKRKMAVTDGTTEGTVIFNDNGLDTLSPAGFTEFKDKVYFNGYSAVNGHELWSTDGSQEGTSLVRDIALGNFVGNQPHSSSPSHLTALNDTLYFSAYTAFEGPELWSSKGTSSQTAMVVDLHPGFYGSSPTHLNALSDKLFYTAEFYAFPARGVYVYDQSKGTNTRLHKAFLNRAHHFAAYNDKAFFVSSERGQKGWLSDGTMAGTQPLTMPQGSLTVFQSIVFKNSLYIVAGSNLYKLNDDTNVFEIAHASLSNVSSVQEFNGELFMVAVSTESVNTGEEVHRFDGNTVKLVKDIAEGDSVSSNPYNFHVLNDHMIFTAENDANGRELWITDGTEDGTHLLIDINADAASSMPYFCYIDACK
ncbi:hypothetical protein ACU6U9_04300 [Pseudomonas sp. HK3]